LLVVRAASMVTSCLRLALSSLLDSLPLGAGSAEPLSPCFRRGGKCKGLEETWSSAGSRMLSSSLKADPERWLQLAARLKCGCTWSSTAGSRPLLGL
ncbi:hypothetical protein V8C86DRAFT_2856678, partial [Haematococcus lacustris]